MRNPLVAIKERSVYHPPLPFDEWVSYFTLDNWFGRTTMASTREEIEGGFAGYVTGAYERNGIIFACMLARQLLFSEARFQFQEMRQGRPGDLFGNDSLSIIEHPWPGATTGDLLTRAIQDVDLAGNFFAARRPGNRIRRLRPDWVTIVLGSERDSDVDSWDIDAEVIGYIYHPGGRYSDHEPVNLLREQVAHFAPIPDPLAAYRGMSWITPVIREVIADSAARDHKVKFFENGATPNLFVSLDIEDPDKFKRWVEGFDSEHQGVANAYKTLFLGAGSSATVVGNSFQQIDFKTVQSAGETRIATAAGMHPVILGLADSLGGSSLNDGNFKAARRLTADKTLRPLWRNFAGSMETIIPPPSGSRLWIDDRDIPFLADDVKDAAEVQAQQSSAIRQLVDAGFKPESVIDAITAGDLKRLQHSGLMSVQLLPPGTTSEQEGTPPPPEEPVGEDARALLQAFLARYSDKQPRHPAGSDLGGQWSGGPGPGYAALHKQGLAGGFSISSHGKGPKKGYMVSPYKSSETAIPVDQFSRQSVRNFQRKHSELLSKPNHYMGGWRDGDTIYLDVSVNATAKATAKKLAVDAEQLAVYDVVKEVAIETGDL